MTPEQQRVWRGLADDVRIALLEVENTTFYLAAVIRRYRHVHLWAKILVAAASCVPFIAKLASTSAPLASWFTSLVPLLAVSLPLWSPDKIVETASKAHGKHAALLTKLQGLWRDIRVQPTLQPAQAIARFKEQLADIDALRQVIRESITDVPDIPNIRARSAIKDVEDYPLEGEAPRRKGPIRVVLHRLRP